MGVKLARKIKREFHADISQAIGALESAMKKFLIRRILWKIIFRGKGLEFDQYRDYSPDEDAENIDWKASARANKLLAKQFIEERDLNIIFVVDMGSNMVFGSQEKLKCEYAAEVAAALAHLVLISGDKFGFVLFSDKILYNVKAKASRNQFFLFNSLLTKPEHYGGTSDLKGTLEFLMDFFDKSISAVFLISDFVQVDASYERLLKNFAARFETIAVMIRDPLDITLPAVSKEVVLEDPRTGEQLVVNPKLIKDQYEAYAIEQENFVRKLFTDSGADFIDFYTNRAFAPRMAAFLKHRVEKKEYILPRR